ncbi:hypothetical protein DPEC_G00261650 [Dallia pectoralis]|uniref:Uncharacterized protein n=1 Tax=Dallia pectoralis TaxID=75939 RepID=A0ACC2FRS5_DALPE|nr:hypothetical protein DPEC_G00261650 [Dallia pectoralis]
MQDRNVSLRPGAHNPTLLTVPAPPTLHPPTLLPVLSGPPDFAVRDRGCVVLTRPQGAPALGTLTYRFGIRGSPFHVTGTDSATADSDSVVVWCRAVAVCTSTEI